MYNHNKGTNTIQWGKEQSLSIDSAAITGKPRVKN